MRVFSFFVESRAIFGFTLLSCPESKVLNTLEKEGNGAVGGQRRALQPRNVAFSEVQRAARERQRQDE